MHALRKNLEILEAGDRTRREQELEIMLQRYSNVKKALENQHNVERVKLEKLIGNKMQASQSPLSGKNSSSNSNKNFSSNSPPRKTK